MDEKFFSESYGAISGIYAILHKNIPEGYEKRRMLDHLTESGMWFRLIYDLDKKDSQVPEIKAVVKDVKPSNLNNPNDL